MGRFGIDSRHVPYYDNFVVVMLFLLIQNNELLLIFVQNLQREEVLKKTQSDFAAYKNKYSHPDKEVSFFSCDYCALYMLLLLFIYPALICRGL